MKACIDYTLVLNRFSSQKSVGSKLLDISMLLVEIGVLAYSIVECDYNDIATG
jgi:hypothetical protein